MGRQRKITLSDLDPRTMWCECGIPVPVIDKDVVSVKCCLCLNQMHLIPKSYTADLDVIEKEIEEEKERKRLGKRGRPKIVPDKDVEEKPKRKRGRPRKEESEMKDNIVKQVVKKTATKSVENRGRKPSVGGKVLSFIQESKGDVKFNDILSVYSGERDRLGKRGTDEIEKRNCLSTLYIMKRDGKIREVSPKTIYSAI